MLITAAALFAAAAILGILVVTLPAGAINPLDEAWNAMMAQIREPWMLAVAHFMNRVGGGWIAILVVPLVTVAALLLARRPREAFFALAAFAASAALTQLLKHLFGRARPEDMLVVSDFGSFPSGHTANAATIAVVLWLIFPRLWLAVAGALWVVLMALSRTLLSVHWFTDTLGGALVGASAALLVGGMLVGWASLGWSNRFDAAQRSHHAEDPPLS